MAALKVICVNIAADGSSCFLDVVVLRQIRFFILKATKPTLNHDIVSPATFSIHALTDAVSFNKVNVLLTCKLTALI